MSKREDFVERMTPLEAEVLSKLLAGDDPILRTLREQLALARVTEREFTGVGFFTTFEVPASAPRAPCSGRAFGDVTARLDGLAHGAGFVLFLENGHLVMLEGYSYDEEWPDEITGFEVSYASAERDLRGLR
jgi:hypothetical protein